MRRVKEREEKRIKHKKLLKEFLFSLSSPSLPQDDAYMEHEARVLWGVMEYLLPQVGPHVRTLDLAHGKAVSNEVVRET